ncbi:MAG: hypothetical protein KKD94_00865, partial [Nanoarchaeota archaeon]|nr:hypothetical protein [Nanoarchaeota archaeon]
MKSLRHKGGVSGLNVILILLVVILGAILFLVYFQSNLTGRTIDESVQKETYIVEEETENQNPSTVYATSQDFHVKVERRNFYNTHKTKEEEKCPNNYAESDVWAEFYFEDFLEKCEKAEVDYCPSYLCTSYLTQGDNLEFNEKYPAKWNLMPNQNE